MPEIKEPNKKASNELVNIPNSEVREPINPARLPNSNPNLLVFDCIKFESILQRSKVVRRKEVDL